MRQRLFIGRKEEQEILQDALQSREAEMVAVIGRRRVGKIFLIQSVYEKHLLFEVTGLQNAPKKEQLKNFVTHLRQAAKIPFPIATPTDWLDAFNQLLGTTEFERKEGLFFR